MPKSRNRSKAKSGRYQLEPQRRRKARTSPRWYGPLVLGLMGVGVVLIVWNYTRGTEASNTILLVGLGLIAVGFFGTTFWK
jgi:drug/metabolite transporter (DMT)-like permease